jgi:hypothetical protein
VRELKQTLRDDAQADLLEAAGYDRVAYLDWVANGEVSKQKESNQAINLVCRPNS